MLLERMSTEQRADAALTPRFQAQINPNRCGGKAACVRVCPKNVFEIRTIDPATRAGLSILGRIKAWIHGGKQAFAVRIEACDACERCVYACPERAVTLVEAK
jgi:NAD-dependent dihydropyrimidine dehydrogenase PreA subunit